MDILHFLLSLPECIVNRQATETQMLDKFLNRTNHELIRKFIHTRTEYGKDANKSQSLRQAGNEYYAKQDYVNAMVRYNESLEFAPPDSLEYGTALASRSTLLFELKRYKDCLVDISRVLRSKYPKLLMHRVYIQQAKCLMEIQSYIGVAQVFTNIEHWLQSERGNLSSKNFDYLAENIQAIEKTLRNTSETVFTFESELTLPVVAGGENQKFAYASKTIVFKKNGVGGRHVVANSDVKKGDILFVEEPYSTSCTSTHSGYFTYCNQCFLSSLTCIPCKFCTEIYFCTEKCRDDYWNLRHRWECLAIRKRLLSTKCSLALGIFFRAARTGFKTAAKNDHNYGNKEENFPYVNQLLTHKMEMAEWNLIYKTKEAALMLVYLIEYTDFIDSLYAQENRTKMSRLVVHKMFGNILLKILLQIGSNSETVLHSFVMCEDKFSPGLNYHTVAAGLYVSSCLINHSCLPNAMRSFHGSTKVVRALTDIKKGTEITVCYLRDLDINSHKSRESILLEKYLFACSCRVCTNSNWMHPWLCDQCQGEALTTSSNRTAQCRDCNHTFSLDPYMQKELRAHACRNVCGLYGLEPSILQTSLDIIQQVYHKNNYKFMYWYSLIVKSSNLVGDFQKSLQYVCKMAQLQRVISGDNACTENINMELKLVNGFVNCCLSFGDKTTDKYLLNCYSLYRTALQDAKDAIDHCCDMLKYHMSNELAECYRENMWKILSVGDLNYDQTVQLYHFNSIPFSTNDKVQSSYTTNPSYNSFKQ